jgi:hypothetical protein
LGYVQANTSRVKVRALVSSFLLAAVSIGAASAGPQQPAAPSQASEPEIKITPSETVIYEFARTLIDWTPQQIRDCPSLRKLRPAGSQDQLPMILERAGQTGDTVFRDFPQVSCDEVLTSETSDGKTHSTKPQRFRYIVIPRPVGDVRTFEEYRTDPEGNPPTKISLDAFYMITSGFASTWLYLSPAEQHDSRFRYFGSQTIRNRECHVVGFAQNPEKARRIGGLRIGNNNFASLVQGLAWIDTRTFQILRITTWLLAPRTDIDLTSDISMVDFYPVHPLGTERVLWLPRDVRVWALYRGVALRNTHHYSNFKLFRVESTIKPGR